MADNVTFQSATPATPPAATVISTEDVTSLNGTTVAAQQAQRVIVALRTADATAKDVVPGQTARANSLPAALSTEDAALLADLLTNTNFQARIPTNGQKAMAGSVPVVVASDQSAIPISAGSLPLPSGAATESTLAALNTKIPAAPAAEHTTAGSPNAARLTDGSAFYKATTPSDTQPISAASLPLPAGAATAAKQPALGTAGSSSSDVISIQGVASGTPVPVSAASLPLPSGAATESTLVARLSESDFDTKIGSLTETAPGTDTASSGLNGRLQRIAQRLTSLIGMFANDATDRIRVSLYGKNSAAGDTAVLLDSSGRQHVVGASAAGAAVAGNPLLLGASDGTNAQNLRVDSSANPRLQVSLYGNLSAAGDTALPAATPGNNVANPTGALAGASFLMGWSGSTWDRLALSQTSNILGSSARTTTTNSADVPHYNYRAIALFVNVTSAGTGSISPSIQIKDSITGNYKTIWTAATALTANGDYVYLLALGSPATASWTEVVSAIVTRNFRVSIVHNNANSITYSCSLHLIA